MQRNHWMHCLLFHAKGTPDSTFQEASRQSPSHKRCPDIFQCNDFLMDSLPTTTFHILYFCILYIYTYTILYGIQYCVTQDPHLAQHQVLLCSQDFWPLNSAGQEQRESNQPPSGADGHSIEHLGHLLKLLFLLLSCWPACLILLADHHWNLCLSWDFLRIFGDV